MDTQDHHHDNISSAHEYHTCRRCGWPFPNPNPSAEHRRAHKKICGTIEGYKLVKSNVDDEPSDDDDGPKMEEKRVAGKSINSEAEMLEFSDGVCSKELKKISDSGVSSGNENVKKLSKIELGSQLLKADTTVGENIFCIPTEIVEEIFSRLPVRSLVRFKTLSKMWCSVIRSSCFATAHLTRSLSRPQDGCPLLFIGSRMSNSQCHILSGLNLGGLTTLLVTLSNIPAGFNMDHVSGLVLLRTEHLCSNFACISNPSTGEVFKLSGRSEPIDINAYICYFLGHDPSTNEFKVLKTRITGFHGPKELKINCEIFTVSTRTWRQLGPSVFPFNLNRADWLGSSGQSVCLNGIIYMILCHSCALAAFDLQEEKCFLIPLPDRNITDPPSYESLPYLIDYRGSVAVVCYRDILAKNSVELWVLVDSGRQSWLKEVIQLPGDWEGSTDHLPMGSTSNGELWFSSRPISRGFLTIPFYNAHHQSFRFAQFSFPEDLEYEDVQFSCCGAYLETILHIRDS